MSFNTYGKKETVFGGGKVVWRMVNAKYQSGGVFSSDTEGLIPAGTPVAVEPGNGLVTVIKDSSTLTEVLEKNMPIGFTENDCDIRTGERGTCAIVVDGELYVDRVDYNFSLIKAVAGSCPKITLIYDVYHDVV